MLIERTDGPVPKPCSWGVVDGGDTCGIGLGETQLPTWTSQEVWRDGVGVLEQPQHVAPADATPGKGFARASQVHGASPSSPWRRRTATGHHGRVIR